MITDIALHEWRRLRAGMMFWVLLAFGQLIIAWLAALPDAAPTR